MFKKERKKIKEEEGGGGEGRRRGEGREGEGKRKKKRKEKPLDLAGWHVTSAFKFYQLAPARGFSRQPLLPITDGMEKSDC